MELLGNQGERSGVLGNSKRERENDELTDTSDLLDRILARNNMLKAMKRVIANKGSHGVDGMGYDQLRELAKLLEVKLKLKVNREKSKVDLVTRRKFLGFSFYFDRNRVQVKIHEKSYSRFKDKIREVTNRNKGISIDYFLKRLNEITVGWINYFSIAKAKIRIKSLE